MAVVLLAFPVLNCTQMRAKSALREGHRLYREASFRKAIEQYTLVLERDPGNVEGTFYLGSCYHQLYVPGKSETKTNLDQAISKYKDVLAAPAAPEDPKYVTLKKNALSALIGIYSDNPYREFDQSKRYADQLTSSDPSNLQNLFAMANLYEKFWKVNEAEAAYRRAFEVAPKDARACGALASFYNKLYWDEKGAPVAEDQLGRGRFKDAVDQLKVCAALDPKDPKGYYTVATFYWDQCYRGKDQNDDTKRKLADQGMEFVNQALGIKGEFVEALIYKGLLLREQAKLANNPAKRNSLIEEAIALQKKALDLKKQQEAEAAEKARLAAAAAAVSQN